LIVVDVPGGVPGDGVAVSDLPACPLPERLAQLSDLGTVLLIFKRQVPQKDQLE
jgi:hypothetical protein